MKELVGGQVGTFKGGTVEVLDTCWLRGMMDGYISEYVLITASLHLRETGVSEQPSDLLYM